MAKIPQDDHRSSSSRKLDEIHRKQVRKGLITALIFFPVYWLLVDGYSIWRSLGEITYHRATHLSAVSGAGPSASARLKNGIKVRFAIPKNVPIRPGSDVWLIRSDRAFLRNAHYTFFRYPTELDTDVPYGVNSQKNPFQNRNLPPLLTNTLTVGAIAIAIVWLYLSVLATFITVVDRYWSRTIRLCHVLMIWLLPFVGAMIKFHMVHIHSPELIERLWIPWPFRNSIESKPFGGTPKGEDFYDDI